MLRSGVSIAQRRLLSTKPKNAPTFTSTTYEYSVTPHTFTYRLPSHSYPYNEVFTPTSPFSPLFASLSNHPLNKVRPQEFFDSFALTNSKRLLKKEERPTKVKMLAADFIEDSLYNPNYGYFPTQAEIFQTESPFKYDQLKDSDDFMSAWMDQYTRYGLEKNNTSMQLWHTPTELFQPFYGEAIARYLLVNYKLNLYPYHDLVIYEVGGGNGTLMSNILDYIKKNDADVYSRTQYRIIEISKSLAEKQRVKKMLWKMKDKGHTDDTIQVINKSIMDWDELVPEPCFVLGMEVLDNLAHDVVKYDINTGECYQGYVVIDDKGDFHEFFSPELDHWTRMYLRLRGDEHRGESKWKGLLSGGSSKGLASSVHPLNDFKSLQKLKNWVSPFNNSLSVSEFIPTRLLKMFSVLNQYFPEHQLVLSDFDSFQGQGHGYNGPVVQTMVKGRMVAASTYLVQQGYFDIMFATDFHLARDMYIQICGKLVETSKHDEFLSQWGDVSATTTINGENPLLDFYPNAAFLHS